MKYLDSNVLVRIITGDNPDLAAQAIDLIQNCAQHELCVLDAILVEVCFILEFHDYKMARHDIGLALEALVATPQIYVAEDTIWALQLYQKHSKLDYADCLLIALGGKSGWGGVVTFDKDLKKAFSATQ